MPGNKTSIHLTPEMAAALHAAGIPAARAVALGLQCQAADHAAQLAVAISAGQASAESWHAKCTDLQARLTAAQSERDVARKALQAIREDVASTVRQAVREALQDVAGQ